MADKEILTYSTSLVTQGEHRFYSFTMPSDVLAECSFVTSRKDDPDRGFQRNLDKKRAQNIADYIDSGLGTIPSAIVLSAQPEAELKIVGRGKSIEFVKHPNAFLVIDGQHRVYGFSMAATALRVPVVVYNGLTKAQEAQLFIDINTTQRPVPNELLLDIKRLAEKESNEEEYLRNLFDVFDSDARSCLLGQLSSTEKAKGRISRVTFNSAAKPLLPLFEEKDESEVFVIINVYLSVMRKKLGAFLDDGGLNNATLFRAIMEMFKPVAQKLIDRHGRRYTYDNFEGVIEPMVLRMKGQKLRNPGSSYKSLAAEFQKAFANDTILL